MTGAARDKFIENSPEIQGRLRREIKRTGVRAIQFYDLAPHIPEHFKKTHLLRWVSGEIKNIRKVDLDFVLDYYASLGDRKMSITKEKWIFLQKEIARTGIKSTGYILDHPDKPKGLSA
ncbi:MAG: hypothetical protein JKY84_02490 [Emcibacteraceae bacterium]|nr:hypothetical protein [Emcibacteraceae bacterium]